MKAITVQRDDLRTYIKVTVIFAVTFGLLFWISHSYAADAASGETFTTVAKRVTGTFRALAKLITAASYLAGLGFAVGAVLKFKQHKDNPTQIPIGTPIAMLFVAAALIFLPSIFAITGASIFGENATTGGPSGVAFEVKK